MALGDIDIREGPVASLVGQQEGGDPGGIGLERQDHHVEHELDMLAERARDAGRSFDGWTGEVFELLGLFEPAFDLADAGQVLVELLLIVAAKLLLEREGVFTDEIKDRALLLSPKFQAPAALS